MLQPHVAIALLNLQSIVNSPLIIQFKTAAHNNRHLPQTREKNVHKIRDNTQISSAKKRELEAHKRRASEASGLGKSALSDHITIIILNAHHQIFSMLAQIISSECGSGVLRVCW